MDRDSVSGRWERSLRAFKLNEVSMEGNAVVVEHSPGGCKTEDVPEINACDVSMNVAEMIGTGKTGVVLPERGSFEETVGFRDR